MGIYYGVFNFTKREWFTGHDLNQGAKWEEALHGLPSKALWVLLAEPVPHSEWQGRWAGNDVRVLRDGGFTWREVIELRDADTMKRHDEEGDDANDHAFIPGWVCIGDDLAKHLDVCEGFSEARKPVGD